MLCAVSLNLLFCAPSDATLIKVIHGYFNSNLVTGQNSDIVHSELSRDMSSYDVPIGKLNLEGCVGKCLNDRTFKFDYIIFSQDLFLLKYLL